MATKERFTVTELCALRNDLIQGGMVDSREAAELLQVFLAGRGYGVSQEAAIDAAGRVEISGCSLPVLERELEGLACFHCDADAGQIARRFACLVSHPPI